MAPGTVAEAVRLKAEWPEATLVAGGTFVGILTRQGLLASENWISLQDVRELRELSTGSELALGAMGTHRRIELDPGVAAGWPGVRQVFAADAITGLLDFGRVLCRSRDEHGRRVRGVVGIA